MLMVHDMMGMIKYSPCSIVKVRGIYLKGGGGHRRTKSPSMSFDRNVGDIGLERRRGGHSCVPKLDCLGGGEVVSGCVCVYVCLFVWWIGGGLEWEAVATGHSGLIIINHLSGHMFMAWASVIPFREAKAAGPV